MVAILIIQNQVGFFFAFIQQVPVFNFFLYFSIMSSHLFIQDSVVNYNLPPGVSKVIQPLIRQNSISSRGQNIKLLIKNIEWMRYYLMGLPQCSLLIYRLNGCKPTQSFDYTPSFLNDGLDPTDTEADLNLCSSPSGISSPERSERSVLGLWSAIQIRPCFHHTL